MSRKVAVGSHLIKRFNNGYDIWGMGPLVIVSLTLNPEFNDTFKFIVMKIPYYS
jgi:hypothetical protein